MDAQTIQTIVLISNTLVMSATLVATLYRIKIEKKQVEIVAENTEAKKCLEILKKHIKLERDEIMKMNDKDLREFLDSIEKIGED